ncbi:hypothetical protein BKA70DRAFT_1528141 [Coprinopsis sp. MPI-PUGE-AT-0042]|nr:hypothetical protein BKA70DRAFT_1528141 [Coprinopsis sp. MPI-PUGE-AT-0042]
MSAMVPRKQVVDILVLQVSKENGGHGRHRGKRRRVSEEVVLQAGACMDSLTEKCSEESTRKMCLTRSEELRRARRALRIPGKGGQDGTDQLHFEWSASLASPCTLKRSKDRHELVEPHVTPSSFAGTLGIPQRRQKSLKRLPKGITPALAIEEVGCHLLDHARQPITQPQLFQASPQYPDRATHETGNDIQDAVPAPTSSTPAGHWQPGTPATRFGLKISFDRQPANSKGAVGWGSGEGSIGPLSRGLSLCRGTRDPYLPRKRDSQSISRLVQLDENPTASCFIDCLLPRNQTLRVSRDLLGQPNSVQGPAKQAPSDIRRGGDLVGKRGQADGRWRRRRIGRPGEDLLVWQDGCSLMQYIAKLEVALKEIGEGSEIEMVDL